MQIHSVTFETSAATLDTCPESTLPEFALIGRSNVGKSSLINMLTNRKLADVSKTPGRTRLINFYLINKNWTLVDLPGYGYAKASGTDRKKFEAQYTEYAVNRKNRSCLLVLIDSRHSPQKPDLLFAQWLVEYEVPFVLVFTKTDKIKPGTVKRNIELFTEAMEVFSEKPPRIFTCSSKTREGRKEILGFIREAITLF